MSREVMFGAQLAVLQFGVSQGLTVEEAERVALEAVQPGAVPPETWAAFFMDIKARVAASLAR